MGSGGGGGGSDKFFKSELERINKIEPSGFGDMPMASGIGVSKNYGLGLRNPLYGDFMPEEAAEENSGLPAGTGPMPAPTLLEMVREAERAKATQEAAAAAGLPVTTASTLSKMR